MKKTLQCYPNGCTRYLLLLAFHFVKLVPKENTYLHLFCVRSVLFFVVVVVVECFPPFNAPFALPLTNTVHSMQTHTHDVSPP